MTEHAPTRPTVAPPLRLWPGVVIVALQWVARYGVPLLVPEAAGFGVIAGIVGGLLLLIWWLGFSRARWVERMGAIALIVVLLLVTRRLVHPSIANGMMGMMLPIYALPFVSLALVAWAAASRHLAPQWRYGALLGALALACGAMTLVRTGGLTGDGVSDLHWRWTPTPEERLLAAAGKDPASPAAVSLPSVVPTPPAVSSVEARASIRWPGFRGPQRDSIVRGTQIATDWSQAAPRELWRRPIGPGWSSFAVEGDRCYTQEQRGDEEIVACYELATGAPAWTHADVARFWESNAGAGPRGTPTLHDGRVYTLGATGILNALDARTGRAIWSRPAADDTKRKVPEWGISSSPLVVGDRVIIATAGVLAAYDANTGAPRWVGPKGGWGYSSPHLATLGGIAQIVLLDGAGAKSVAPADGALLWEHAWKSDGIVQPAVLADGDILLGSGSGMGGKVGLRRVAITRGPTGWTTDERWTSLGLKAYFNDFVVHRGHAYGFDGNRLACVDVSDGARKWKGGNYGSGQLLLLADQDLLLVLSERGDLALVQALPEKFAELARRPALTGKTWNHPVLAGDILLVRNDREMAAFRLLRKGG